jgi:hypothetical protein
MYFSHKLRDAGAIGSNTDMQMLIYHTTSIYSMTLFTDITLENNEEINESAWERRL